MFDNGAHEVMAISEAQRTAARLGKDLLPVAPGAQPPVFKLGHQDAQAAADRRRYKEQRKRELEQRRKMAVKEVPQPSAPLDMAACLAAYIQLHAEAWQDIVMVSSCTGLHVCSMQQAHASGTSTQTAQLAAERACAGRCA